MNDIFTIISVLAFVWMVVTVVDVLARCVLDQIRGWRTYFERVEKHRRNFERRMKF